MFSNKPIKTLIIQEDLKPTNQKFFKPRPKRHHETCWYKIKTYMKLFMETSSIHGLNHLVATRRHYCEIILWLTIIVLSASGSLYLSIMTWARYQSSPTVISMDRDMLAWNTTFPAVTLCPSNNVESLDKKKLQSYLSKSTDANTTQLEDFIYGLVNATYKSFEYVLEYPGISPDDYVGLIVNLSMPFTHKLTLDSISNTNFTIVPVITEMGLCFTINSKTGIYNSPEYRANNRWDIIESQQTFSINPLDGEVFAKIAVNVPYQCNVYLHSPLEIPDITSKFHELIPHFYLKSYVTAVTVYTSADAASLRVNQRRCRYPHENNLEHNTIYTYTICQIECRLQLCLKYCNCIPHFYRRIGDEKICDVQGLHCLSKHTDELYTLRDKDGKRINCQCFPLCDDVYYILEPINSQYYILGTNLQWGMATYPRTRYRRDIIFGFTDVLVAVGSMAGLFLGCCVLSFMEIIYFFTLRLLCYSYGHRSSK